MDFLNTSALVDGRWQPLGDAFLASSEFVVSDGELLYAYGIFRLEDGDPVSRMATWDGLEWTIFPNAPDWSSVRAMVLHDGELYLGGEGRDSQGALAVFRDGAWNEIALPPGDRVYALASIDGRLVVARLFATDSDAIIELDGGSWRRFRNIEADSGFHLHSAGGRVVVGGSSLIHQQQPGDNVMVHREDTWHVLGTKSVPGGILHLGVDGDALLIGSFGLFPDVGRVSLVARYDGTTFSPVVDDGSADVLLSQVYTTLAEGDRLYIGGRFVGDGDRWSTCVTMVEDGRWVPMDRGLNNNVNRILRYGDDLLAVGAFSSNYDEPVVTGARWNGTNWEQFGDGRLSGTATDAIVFEDRLVLCGTTLEGDYPDGGIHRIAYWDESVGRWRELGTDGLDHSPLETAERDGSLYVLASNPSRGTKRVMRLEDNRWEYFTDPIDGRWGTFAWYKGQVYVGSWGGGSSGLSRWEGDRWFEIGDRFLSTSLDVREIQVANGELWIAGGFTGVDDIVSPNLIRLRCGCEADFDADGELTIFDYLAFFNALEMGETAADLDGDGAFTVLDFQAFQQAFVAGCP
ncbi:MAG: GC-type dockerin domain-anchored protein [Phycisphaerales bacterium]